MIRHVVGFRLAAGDPEARRADAGLLKRELEALRGAVPSLRSLEVGLEFGDAPPHWDAVLISEFANRDDLAAYHSHPEHARVIALTDPFIADRAIIDYEF